MSVTYPEYSKGLRVRDELAGKNGQRPAGGLRRVRFAAWSAAVCAVIIAASAWVLSCKANTPRAEKETGIGQNQRPPGWME